MKSNLNRREFLKIAGLLSAGATLPYLVANPSVEQQNKNAENVLIVVFDAWSANHVSLYGFDRRTTPNIERLAEKATVYHNHVSGGNYTLPATTALLTGMLPWRHRAFGFPIDKVRENFAEKSIFHLFPDYHRMAYTHNRLANQVLNSFFMDIEDHTPLIKHMLHSDFWVNTLFENDKDNAELSFLRAMKPQEEELNYSLFLSRIYEASLARKFEKYGPLFPRGLPNFNIDNYYLLEDAINWLMELAPSAPQPFLGYYHFLPPHNPYNTRVDFFQTFSKDGYVLPNKTEHIFSSGKTYENTQVEARYYDEYILYVDSEFARLYESLEISGLLENTWLILTADHGELFERGIIGHVTPALYHSIVHIPLLIFAPGQTTRHDIYENTSAVDILPTLLEITGRGHSFPEWAEGRVLPPFNPLTDSKRDVFTIEADGVKQNEPMTFGSVNMIRDNYKMLYYFGYPELDGGELVELYNLENDPQELENLIDVFPDKAKEMLEVILQRLKEENQPYQQSS
jgi:arylsulfatase A-like enzyme